MTEKPELENDYGSNVDALVDSMPVAPPTTHDVNAVHNELLNDPHYAVHLHERQLERLTTFVGYKGSTFFARLGQQKRATIK